MTVTSRPEQDSAGVATTGAGGEEEVGCAGGETEEIAAVSAEPVGLVDAGSAVAREHGGVDDSGLRLGAAAVADAHHGVVGT